MTAAKVGDRIRLDAMPDDPDPLPAGSTGRVVEVTHFGDWSQLVVNWDSGRCLCLSVPPDRFSIISAAATGV